MENGEKFICQLCEKIFTKLRYLKQHVNNVHGVIAGIPQTNLLCPEPDCSTRFCKYSQVREHLQNIHDIFMDEGIELQFHSRKDFLDWKLAEEENTRSSFVKYSSARQVKGGRKTYYTCHRSGLFRSKSLGSRALKSQRSYKMNSTCPAMMTLTEMDGEDILHVLYYPTHYGHSRDAADLKKLNLSLQDRKFIAEKLRAGASTSRILKDIRADGENGEKKRIHYVTHKDIWNIRRSVKLKETEKMIKIKKTEQTVKPDTVSVQFWVNQLQENGKAILILKPQGKLTDKIKEINLHHKKSLLIEDNYITCVSHGKEIGKCICGVSATYNVKSVCGTTSYTVQPSLAKCIKDCQLRCKLCKICSHEYKCTCPGYRILCNICEHIHAVCRRQGKDNIFSQGATNDAVEYKTEVLKKLKSLLLAAEKASLSDDVWNEISKGADSLLDYITKSDLKTNLRVAHKLNKSLDNNQNSFLSVTESNFKTKRKAYDYDPFSPVNKKQNCDTNITIKRESNEFDFVPEVSLNKTQECVTEVSETGSRKKQIVFDWERTKSLKVEEKDVPKTTKTFLKRKPIIFDWERNTSLNENTSISESNLKTKPKAFLLLAKEKTINNSSNVPEVVTLQKNHKTERLVVHTGFDHEYCK